MKPNNTLPHSESTPPTTTASADAELQQACALREGLGARGTGRGHGHGHVVQAQHALQEFAGGVRRVHRLVAQVLGKFAGRRQARVGLFGGADAGGGRAEHQRDASGAVTRARRVDRFQEAIPLQAQPRETVVAAFVGGEFRRQRRGLRRPATRPIQVASGSRPKSLGAQAGAAGVERAQQLSAARAGGAGGREGGDAERLHADPVVVSPTWMRRTSLHPVLLDVRREIASEAKMRRLSSSSERSWKP